MKVAANFLNNDSLFYCFNVIDLSQFGIFCMSTAPNELKSKGTFNYEITNFHMNLGSIITKFNMFLVISQN